MDETQHNLQPAHPDDHPGQPDHPGPCLHSGQEDSQAGAGAGLWHLSGLHQHATGQKGIVAQMDLLFSVFNI